MSLLVGSEWISRSMPSAQESIIRIAVIESARADLRDASVGHHTGVLY